MITIPLAVSMPSIFTINSFSDNKGLNIVKKTSAIFILFSILFSFALLSACSEGAGEANDTGDFIAAEDLTQIELIDDTNRDFVGKEIQSDSAKVIDSGELPNVLNGSVTEDPAAYEIPENTIVQSTAADEMFLGTSIQEIEVSGTRTPELIAPNGAEGIFSQGNAAGWACKAGDTIIWSFEKYPLTNGQNQALAVGYIKDGVMYESQVYQDRLSATYQLDVSEDGIYYIYFISASSDPISLKEGEIKTNSATEKTFNETDPVTMTSARFTF